MSDSSSEIKRLCLLLHKLLDDPYPGVLLWKEARNRAARDLYFLLKECVGE